MARTAVIKGEFLIETRLLLGTTCSMQGNMKDMHKLSFRNLKDGRVKQVKSQVLGVFLKLDLNRIRIGSVKWISFGSK
jgi:hypothetical protein